MTENNILYDLINKIPKIIIPDKTNLELECRFSIDDRKIEKNKGKKFSVLDTIKIAKYIISNNSDYKHEISQSINFIKGLNLIKQISFINGIQQKNKQLHYSKESIINPLIVIDTNNNSPNYKITLSFEKEIDEFNISDCKNARIKLRYSIFIKQWRLDITLVKNIENLSNSQELKNFKEEIFFKIDIKNFINEAPWDLVDIIEFEMEYMDSFDKLNIDTIKFADTFINKQIDNMFFNKQTDFNKLSNNTNLSNSIDDKHEHKNSMNEYQNDIHEHKNTNSNNYIDEKNNMYEYQNKIYEIAKWVKPKQSEKFKHNLGLKQLGNQPIELDKNIFLKDLYNKLTDYYITDKVDGKRTIIYINNGNIYALSNTIKYIENNFSELINNNDKSTYIIDCEEYNNVYYLFDVMVYNNTSLINEVFDKRLEYFPKCFKLLKNLLFHKEFIKLSQDYKNQIKELKNKKRKYETDGFILTPANEKYNDMIVYKYKPLDKLSIDFLIKKCPQKLLGIKPYMNNNSNLYILFCGISKNMYKRLNMKLIKYYDTLFPNINEYNLPPYFPIQFESSNKAFSYLYWSNKELDNTVGEFIYNKKKSIWELIKIREDRMIEVQRGNYYGNNYKIAESTWWSYENPLIIEDSNDIEEKNYFQVNMSEIHKASRNFNRYVVSEIFKLYQDTDWVLDIASGKGQDLFRYSINNMGNKGGVLFLEIDKTAIQELITRKFDFANDYDKERKYNPMKIYVQQMDLLNKFTNNIKILDESYLPIPIQGFDLIICNFAFHYFVNTHKNILNLLKFINYYIKIGGKFVFTAFDGLNIINLLKDNNGIWNSKTLNKFSIKKAYTTNELLPYGQKINVLLPFSNGEYYNEYLINIKYLEDEFKKYNFILETNTSFKEYFKTYKYLNNLDDDDKLFVGLYHYYSFVKIKKNKLVSC